jgi:IS30 family transposase
MAYHQLTSDERYTIGAMRQVHFTIAQIAQKLGRHAPPSGAKSTVIAAGMAGTERREPWR